MSYALCCFSLRGCFGGSSNYGGHLANRRDQNGGENNREPILLDMNYMGTFCWLMCHHLLRSLKLWMYSHCLFRLRPWSCYCKEWNKALWKWWNNCYCSHKPKQSLLGNQIAADWYITSITNFLCNPVTQLLITLIYFRNMGCWSGYS